MLLRRHLATIGMTGSLWILHFICMTIGKWFELPIGFANFQDIFADQLLPQMEMWPCYRYKWLTSSSNRTIIEDM